MFWRNKHSARTQTAISDSETLPSDGTSVYCDHINLGQAVWSRRKEHKEQKEIELVNSDCRFT